MVQIPSRADDVIARGYGIRIEPGSAPVSSIEPVETTGEGQADVPPRKARGRPRKVKT